MTAALRRQVTAASPDGCLIINPGDGSREEQKDTVQCCHCGKHWILGRAMQEALRGDMGFCSKCNSICCPKCSDKCVPQERFLEILEGADPTTIQVGGFRVQHPIAW